MYHLEEKLNELSRKASKDPHFLVAAKRELFRSSLYLTTRHLLRYQEVNWYTHQDAIETLESDKTEKLIVMPRGTFKTSLAVVGYSIWLLLRNPNLRILIDSELYTNSQKSLREIKQHLESDLLTSFFGEFRTDSVWNESEIIIKQRTIVKKEASITVSGIGAQKTGQHYDVIIADDLNSPKNSNTKENRQKVIDHWKMYTSILDPGGIRVLVGTRYHVEDCIGHVLRNEIFLKDEDEEL